MSILNMNGYQQMITIHQHLMRKGFPYHSVSVLCHRDLGLHVLFMKSVKDMVDEDVLNNLRWNGFTHAFVIDSSDESWRPELQNNFVT
jgi:hypothetical protein